VLELATADAKNRVFDWRWTPNAMTVWVILLGAFFLQWIPYTSDQTVVQRYLSTRDEKEAAKSMWMNIAILLPGTFLFSGLGVSLYTFYKSHPDQLTPGMNDEILPQFIVQQLPPGVAGLVIAGIFAAAMSSLDSSMNSIASAYVNDFHYRLFRLKGSDHAQLRFARGLTLLIGTSGTAMALVMATIEIRSLFDHFNMIMGMICGGLAGVFMLAIFTRRANTAGALIGALVGMIVPLAVKHYTEVNFYLYAPLGVGSAFAAGYLASLVLPGGKRNLAGLTVYTLSGES